MLDRDMLLNFTNTQTVADMLKPLIEHSATGMDRATAVRTLQHFERAGWNALAFEDAASRAPGEFNFDAVGQIVYAPSDNSAAEIAAVLEDYLALVGPPEQVTTMDLFTTEQAAEYLNMSVAGVKKNIHTTKRLHPARRVGRSLMFTRDELDRFQREERHKPGFEAGSKPKK